MLHKDVQCLLVGNKLDMESDRQVPKEIREELAKKLKMLFLRYQQKKILTLMKLLGHC